MSARRAWLRQVDDQLEVRPRLGCRIVGGALCLRNLGDINGGQKNLAQGLFVSKFNDRMRVGHVHPDAAHRAIDSRNGHRDRLARRRGSGPHVDAVARAAPLILGLRGDALDTPARGHVQRLPDRQIHEPLTAQVIDEDAHAVAAHLSLRTIRVAVIHEPHSIALDGPNEAIGANPESRGAQRRDLNLAGIVVVVLVRGDDEGITGTVGLDDAGVGGQLRVHHGTTVAPVSQACSRRSCYERPRAASASRCVSSTTWRTTASFESKFSTSSQCTRGSGRSHLTWRRAS